MLTQSSKVFFPVVTLSLVLAIAYVIFTGNRDGELLYVFLAIAAGGCGMAVAGARNNEVVAPATGEARAPEMVRVDPGRPVGGGLWPVTGALAAGLLAAGFLLGFVLTAAGLVLVAATIVGWMATSGAERSGRELNLMPLGLPVVGLFSIFSLMFFMSRVLLAVPEKASTVIALAVAITILGSATFVALRPALSARAVIAALAVLLTGGGVVAAAVGQRKVEKPAGVSAGPVKVVAQGIQFVQKEIKLKAGLPADITFNNKDAGTPHNIAIYRGPDHTQQVFTGDIVPGPISVDYRFTAPPAGPSFYRCDVHPSMQGRVDVTA
jgi:plastocyanin